METSIGPDNNFTQDFVFKFSGSLKDYDRIKQFFSKFFFQLLKFFQRPGNLKQNPVWSSSLVSMEALNAKSASVSAWGQGFARFTLLLLLTQNMERITLCPYQHKCLTWCCIATAAAEHKHVLQQHNSFYYSIPTFKSFKSTLFISVISACYANDRRSAVDFEAYCKHQLARRNVLLVQANI